MAVDVLEGLLEEDDEVVQVSDQMCPRVYVSLAFNLVKMHYDFVFLV